ITAVDTNVLIDVFRNDPEFGLVSADALRRCFKEGHFVACNIVWAEIASVFSSRKSFEAAMRELPIEFSPVNEDAAVLAGDTWRQYRARGGKRTRVLPGFLIAAHIFEAPHASR
ncbi:MAG: PIN domain-containing protein, partial [Candidatus Hydrogenedentota bacterium]